MMVMSSLLLPILMMMLTTIQAANYDNWPPFILLAGILAFFAAGVFILGTWKVLNMIVDLSMTSVNFDDQCNFYGNLGCLDAR